MTIHSTTVHTMTDPSSSLSGLLARDQAQYGLPLPLNDDEGGSDCYPNEDSETGTVP